MYSITFYGLILDIVGVTILFLSGGLDLQLKSSQIEIEKQIEKIDFLRRMLENHQSSFGQSISRDPITGVPQIGMNMPDTNLSMKMQKNIADEEARLKILNEKSKSFRYKLFKLKDGSWSILGYVIIVVGFVLQLIGSVSQ